MDIIDKFFKKLSTNGIEFIPRKSNHKIWNEEFAKLDYQPIEYSADMIDYQNAYLAHNESNTYDLSIIILSGGKICGLWLLTALESKECLRLTSSGQPVLAPLFLDSTTRKQRKKICSNAMNCLINISDMGFQGPLVTCQGPIGINCDTVLTDWYRQGMEHNANVSVRHEMYIDLSLTLDEIRSYYRKSYKPFINKGLKEWESSILTSLNIDKKKWNQFKHLHETASGRVTRNDSTWEKQYQMINSGRAFLVMLNDLNSKEFVGGGFFQTTRDEGLYSVGAYNRKLFDKPLGHVVQQIAINHMKSLGLKWYKIGERHYLNNSSDISKKEIDIAKFKEGFCTDMKCKFELSFTETENKKSL